jgi:TRAP-type uncharacterized transport system substrate-binding protein
MENPRPTHRRWIALWIGIALLLLVVAWAVVKVVSPSPPGSIAMSTGVVDGAYHQFALKYQAILKDNGIVLELKPSSGSVENLKRLNAGDVSVAFVQGGLATEALGLLADPQDSPLRSLATIGFEPVWIFSHTLKLSEGLAPLTGKKVAMGVAGSGNYKVALELLGNYGVVDKKGLPLGGTQLIAEGGLAAVEKLQAHELDAMIVIAAPQAPSVMRLLNDSKLQLASLAHAEGLARRNPYFQTVILKRGSVDPARNLPAHDIKLLATTANLVIRDELHPALAYLLLEAANQIHGTPSLLNRPGEFPSAQGTDFGLADEATRYFKNGRPFLQTYLPFWVANLVQRMALILIPLIAVLLPLFKIIPPLRDWRLENRLYRRYGELKFLEQNIATRTLSAEESEAARQRLDSIEREVIETRFPHDFSDRVHVLQQHVDYVRAKLAQQARSQNGMTA